MSPKSLDPLSKRRNDSADAESTPVMPRGVDTTTVLEKAQATVEARREAQAKSKRKLIFSFLAAGLFIFLVGAGVLFYRSNPTVDYGEYAFVGGKDDDIKVSKQLADDIKKSLEKKAQDEKSQLNPTDEAEKKVAIWAALQEHAQEVGEQCTPDDVQLYLRSQRKLTEKINLRDYYILNEQAGRSKEVVDFQDQSDCLEAKLKTKIITQREYTAMTIRWDYFRKNNKADEAAENRIKERFERDFVPLYKTGASKEEIAKKSDTSYLMSPEQMVEADRKDNGYLSSFNQYWNLLEEKENGARFREYPNEGESNYPQLEKLKNPGDYTPVFRSSTGYYAVFRLENVQKGKYDSYQELIDTYTKKVQLSLATQVKRYTDRIGASIVGLVVKVAQAAEDCLTGASHRITYYVRVENSVTGAAVAGLDLRANTDRSSTLCNPYGGFFEGDQAAATGGSFVGPGWYNQTVTDLIENGRNTVYGYEADAFALDCNGPSWRFSFQNMPANYTFSNAPGSVYGCHQSIYFCPQMTINHGNSAFGPYFDVPYSRGVNGDFFTLLIKLDPDPPPPPPDPTWDLLVAKYDRTGNNLAPWQGANIRDYDTGDVNNGNPAGFYDLLSKIQHRIHADPVSSGGKSNAWRPTSWSLNTPSSSGNGPDYTFAANSVPQDTSRTLQYWYEPTPSTAYAGVLVRDVNGNRLNPCTQSGLYAQPCDSAPTVTIARNGWNLPTQGGGLRNSYTAGPTAVVPDRGTNGLAEVSGLYAQNDVAGRGGANWAYNASINPATVPTGWRIAGWVQCGLDDNSANCFQSPPHTANGNITSFTFGLNASTSRRVYFVLEPATISVRTIKMGPGTFINQNSDTTNIPQGSVTLDGSNLLGEGQNSYQARTVSYDGANHTMRATAPAGWQVRGYGYCIRAAAGQVASCINDASVGNSPGQINLAGNGGTSLDVTINYQTAIASFNGQAVTPGSELFVAFYFKPAPVTVQVRGSIDMRGGSPESNTDINPCSQSDYKRNICNEVELKAVRMNTVGIGNNNASTQGEYGDPAGAYGNCVATDYVPTKPGYNYGRAAETGFYCSRSDNGAGRMQAGFVPSNSPLRYGTTLDAANGSVSNNSSPDENNLAIVRNVYPGKYSFRHQNGPEYNNESAYDIAQSTCAVNVANCGSSLTPNANVNSCLLNHRLRSEFIAVSPFLWWTVYTPIIQPYSSNALNDRAGQDYCTVMWANPGAEAYPNYGSPEAWDAPSVRPGLCGGVNGSWAYAPQWSGLTGSYGIDTSGSRPCGYRKDGGAAKENTFTMGIPPGTNFREQTFYYSPKFRLQDETLTCDNYTATLVYMPDPSRPVTTYYRVGNSNLMRTATSTGSDVMEITTETSGPNAYKINVDIPKYNGQGGPLLKDGDRRSFQVFARYGDTGGNNPDNSLVNGYTSGARDWGTATSVWKYVPSRVSADGLMHQCRNDAICDQGSFESQLDAISVMDADNPQSNEIEVTVQNNGESFWQQDYRDGDNNGAVPGTYHELVVTGGTLVTNNQSDTRAWYIPDPQRRIESGREITPVALNPGASSYTFRVTPTPPRDGGTKFTLGFQMRQAKPASQGGFTQVFGTACEGDFEIKVSYKPWLRVQNGNVTALGQIRNQSEATRGMYKAENRTNGIPYRGSYESTSASSDAKPVINLHSQFVAAAEKGGLNFCSTNFYMLGFAKGQPSAQYGTAEANAPQKSRNCDFDSVSLNIQQAEDSDNDGQKELKNTQMIAAANRAYTEYGQCNDTGNTPDVDDGPQELSPPAKYYRSWATGSADLPSLVWGFRDKPDADDDLPFGKHKAGPLPDRGLYLVNTNAPTGRPCPTIFSLQSSGSGAISETNRELGGFIYNAGRSTIVSDDTVYITGNIEAKLPTDNTLSYSFQKTGKPDMAGLNKLPNLGIISARNIVISSNVTRIDASLYAAGKIVTCDLYTAEAGFNEDAAKTDKPGTTGSKWIRRGAGLSLDSNPLATETEDPNITEAPNADNASARGCSNQLRITGSVTGGDGFMLGRNFVDFGGMVQRWSANEGGAFSGQSPLNYGKFCNLSDVVGIRRVCNLQGVRTDFDSPGTTGSTYWLETKAGWPQNYYTGGPAEDIVGNGLSSFMPPPGFEDITASTNTAKYYNNTARPRF